ncbi:helix-turn-helix transcriptional regulator [Peteryoungia desertarenae]|uniref:Helix-turn-helix transcriptional regulator n=1 Tax=Peteryoungia desertarenae TaxID=1813451 RepID=A0ABX6QLF6_9HYPH|nr:XRE family transcriptional regulator [Peteryoungia desertarenae]QLF69107.1 helix-turn-helix transcriptional regulator [Peteryoungia desertarenae]
MENSVEQFEDLVGEKVRRLRLGQRLTLDQLAALSGVSRAMISKVERAEASPTAATLARLCSALGVSLSVFFADGTGGEGPLRRRKDQPEWRDPESGYLRRAVSATGTGSNTEIIEVEFPPGREVRFEGQLASRSQTQHLWVLAGAIEVTVRDKPIRLHTGDCLFMNVADISAYRNPGDQPCRYAVILSFGAGQLP